MFSGVTLPFTAGEVIEGAFELMKLFGPYIIIGLAIMLMPRFVTILKGIFGKGGKTA